LHLALQKSRLIEDSPLYAYIVEIKYRLIRRAVMISFIAVSPLGHGLFQLTNYDCGGSLSTCIFSVNKAYKTNLSIRFMMIRILYP